MSVHLYVHGCRHGRLSECNIQLHHSIQCEWLVHVNAGSFVRFLEVMLLEAGGGSNSIEQRGTNDRNISSTINDSIGWYPLDRHLSTMWMATIVIYLNLQNICSLI